MGKNRKPKQVINQSSLSDSEENGCLTDVPAEFLTSDDFQVVQKKRHYKRSFDSTEDLPRSRHNSTRVSICSDKEAEEAAACYSSFWISKSQNEMSDGGFDQDDKNSPVEDNTTSGITSIKPVMIETPSSKTICNDPNSDLCDLDKESVSWVNEPLTKTSFEPDLKNNMAPDKCTNSVYSDKVVGEENSVISNGSSEVPRQNSTHELVAELRNNCNPDFANNGSGSFRPANNEPKNELLVHNVDETGNSSTCDAPVPRIKNQKKKKRQKINKSGNSESSDSMPSMDNAPTECLTNNSAETDNRGQSSKQKKENEKQQDRKRPGKKQLAAIQEALKKAKEEEERKIREEETKKRVAEEAERLRLETLRLEQEKKDKKKLKEKQKKEKMKAEGRLLSKSQKQARARMAATLEIFRQQGVEVPQISEKTKQGSRLGNYKNTHRKRFDSSQSDQSVCDKSERHKTQSLSSQESKESFSDQPSSFDSKESLDFISIESSALKPESDTGNLSCSEESDVLDKGHLSNKSSKSSKLKDSLEKNNPTIIQNVKADSNGIVEEAAVKLRSPVVCVLGHVDTGKTKLLDFIRKTHVQDSEAGGITQQIGATMIPQSALKDKCKMVKDFSSLKIQVPGLLVIDTPGHESFRNLRSRGTSLCDIAILVVDIMHGLQAQTMESINLLRTSKIPFVVALNKVDRIYGWRSIKDSDIVDVINSQSENASWEFKKRYQDIQLQFANECLNAKLFYENEDPRSYVSMVPTSAVSGDGMGNLLSVITQLTQSLMFKHLHFSNDLKATVLEVKVIPGLGTTIDVILVNGQLHEGDTIVLAGQDGPIVTQIRSLLMPQPLKELRVKNPYIDYKMVEGAQGVKISGKDFDKTLAGMPVFVVQNPNRLEAIKAEVSLLLCQSISSIKTSERGVYVQASTLGSLEALLDYLTSFGIPYFGVKIGPVVKKDVVKASIMLEHDAQYAAILAFDVKIERDAQELADTLGVKILHADIIYHLFDLFVEHRESHLKRLEEKKHLAIFPCILTLPKQLSADTGSSITFEVIVEAGTLKLGTPLCVPKRGCLDVGTVASIQIDGVSVTSAKEGDRAEITLQCDLQKPLHLDPEDNLVSRISRQSIEVCKEYYRDELCPSDWHLMSELKKVLHNI